MKVGYIKNINNDPSSKGLIQWMEKEGAEKIIIEVANNRDRENYQKMLLESIQNMKEKDILVIYSFDDLGESVMDVINIVEKLDERDIGIQVLDSKTPLFDENNWQMQTIIRKQLLFVLNWIEDKEKNDIKKRQSIGIEKIKALKAKTGSGRPKKYSKYAKDPEDRKIYYSVVEMLENDIPIKRISETLKISRNTIYTIKKEMEKDKHKNSAE